MKKKNGFTLVELLAVIVVLAIIMIIAIPAVLETMNSARKSSFALYAEKVVNAVETQYVYDAGLGQIAGAGYYVYDIKSDLNLNSTGSYKGFVVVDATAVDTPKYILFLYDNNYSIVNYDVSSNGMPDASSAQIFSYDPVNVTGKADSMDAACKNYNQNATCYTRYGYKIVSSTTTSEDPE